ATRRKLLDGNTLSADSRTHRGPRVAPDVIEKADTEGERSRVLLGGVSLGRRIAEWRPVGPGAVNLTGALRPASRLPTQLKGLVARHPVCSATPGSEHLVQIANPRSEGSCQRPTSPEEKQWRLDLGSSLEYQRPSFSSGLLTGALASLQSIFLPI